MPGHKRLSDVVIPGRDYEAKCKIAEVLDHEVLLTGFDHVRIYEEKPDENGELRSVLTQDYWNVKVDDGGVLKTFSTGSVPIVKVLESVQRKLNTGEAELPMMCTFHKEGRTYIVE